MINVRIPVFCILFLLMLTCGPAWSQEDGVPPPRTGADSVQLNTNDPIITRGAKDTVEIESYASRYSPRKAALYAAIIPGAGQIYVKKYWKLPLVYGGIGVTLYALNFYQDLYIDYKAQLFDLLETGTNSKNPYVSESTLRTAITRVRRERDLMLIVMAGVYILQIVDAHVDAHLKEFDVNPNLQVNIRPSFTNDALVGRAFGVSLTVTF